MPSRVSIPWTVNTVAQTPVVIEDVPVEDSYLPAAEGTDTIGSDHDTLTDPSDSTVTVEADDEGPLPTGATGIGTTIRMGHSRALDPAAVPATSEFTLSTGAVTAVEIDGTDAVLTTDTPLAIGEHNRTVSYTGTTLQDEDENLTAAYGPITIANLTDVVKPSLVGIFATIGSSAIRVRFSEALDATAVLDANDFTLAGKTLSGDLSISADTVYIPTSEPIEAEDVITVSFEADAGDPIRDPSLNEADDFTDEPVVISTFRPVKIGRGRIKSGVHVGK